MLIKYTAAYYNIKYFSLKNANKSLKITISFAKV